LSVGGQGLGLRGCGVAAVSGSVGSLRRPDGSNTVVTLMRLGAL